ncbi:MAG: hypothetical protein PHN64_02585 [Desulfovibrionaceae bacterium]|nr:hypothetical protein [Desulfovibrionaceae bacterium]
MSDTARKIFPMESVLALIVGKEDADVKELAGYVAGCSIACDTAARMVGPMVGGWLASCFPKFMDINLGKDQPWEALLSEVRSKLGDNVSLEPMPAHQQAMVGAVLAKLGELVETKKAQAAQIATMQAKIDELTAVEAKAAELSKKVAQQEDTIKTMKTDMSGLRKQLVPFNGKMPVDMDELLMAIKDAIKDNMKGFVAAGAGAAAGAVAGEAAAEAAAETSSVPDDFGFGSSGSNDDGFGF